MEKELLGANRVLSRRILAFAVDYIIIMIISIMTFVLLSNVYDTSVTPEFFRFFYFMMAVLLLCMLLKDIFKGRSIGKMIFGIYVREYGNVMETPKFYKLVLRNILLPFWLIEFLVLVSDKEGRRLGDKIAKTQVMGYQNKISKKVIIPLAVIFIIFIATMTFFANSGMKNDAAYIAAENYIDNQQEITDIAGPILRYTPYNSSMSIVNGYGRAELKIKAYGEKGKLTIDIYLEKEPDSDWVVYDVSYYK